MRLVLHIRFIGNEPFAVLLGDDIVESEVPAVKQLIDVYEETGHSVIGAELRKQILIVMGLLDH